MPADIAKPTVALLGPIPPDLSAALGPDAVLLAPEDWTALPEDRRQGITLALTSAMGGADPRLLDRLPGLRRIASVGAGVDQFDQDWLAARGIELCPTPEVMTEDTAECAITLALAAMRNVAANDRFVRRGDWAHARAPLGRRLSGARVGIVGLGRIGGRIAEKLAALGCEIAYTGRGAKPVPWRFEPDLSQLAAAVDLLVLSCAAGPGTRHLISAEVLTALGPQGYLVNVARGSVVDEEALIDALQTGRIAGAGLDVFENEPRPDPRFADLDRCVLSPHAAVFTRQNRADLIARIRELLDLR